MSDDRRRTGVHLRESTIQALDDESDRRGLNRSKMIERMVEEWREQADEIERLRGEVDRLRDELREERDSGDEAPSVGPAVGGALIAGVAVSFLLFSTGLGLWFLLGAVTAASFAAWAGGLALATGTVLTAVAVARGWGARVSDRLSATAESVATTAGGE